MSRYDVPKKRYNFGSGPGSSWGSEAQTKPQNSALAEYLRLAGTAAPLVGTVGGGVGGAILGAPALGIGAVPGAALGAGLGGAAGTAVGAGLGMAADKMEEPSAQQEDARMRREMERQARMQASLAMLGGI